MGHCIKKFMDKGRNYKTFLFCFLNGIGTCQLSQKYFWVLNTQFSFLLDTIHHEVALIPKLEFFSYPEIKAITKMYRFDLIFIIFVSRKLFREHTNQQSRNKFFNRKHKEFRFLFFFFEERTVH